MAKSLVIVESPAKAKTINKYLGSDYVVEASVGHIMDLPKERHRRRTRAAHLRADPDRLSRQGKGRRPPEEACREGRLRLSRARSRSRRRSHRSAPQDADRADDEGQVASCCGVTFNEITQKAVKAAFEHARDVDENLVDAQQTRRVLDRLVGYQISPLLWDKVRRGLSAGRVQTVALRLIVEREGEINAFQPVEYWNIDAQLDAGSQPNLHGALRRRQRQWPRASPTARTWKARISSLPTRFPIRKRSMKSSRELQRRKVDRAFGREERAPQQSPSALHHQQAAAGCVRPARLQRPPHHGRRPATLRRRRDRQ